MTSGPRLRRLVRQVEEVEPGRCELGNGLDYGVPRIVVDHAVRLMGCRLRDALGFAPSRATELDHQQGCYRE